MLQGVHLTLMIGPAVAVPVPKAVLDALQRVKITIKARETSGFELVFSLNNRSPLQTLFLLAGGSTIPLLRVIIVVTINGTANVLMDGVVTQQQIAPGSDASTSTLTVTGEDLTRAMDYIDFSGIPYPAMPVEARIAVILAKYAALGVIPRIVPRILTETPIPTKQIPKHEGKDKAYIETLAREAGYVFYLDPGPSPGTSVAYWGPEVKIGRPQPALRTNMDAHTNVESLSFRFDGDGRTLPVLLIQEQKSHVSIPIPIPNINPLNPPLGAIPPIPKEIEKIPTTAKLSAIGAALLGVARASRSADAVTGNGSLDVLRYGRVLQARKLVGVCGAGTAFDGLYYVDSVEHDIKRGEYKQQFTLTRNGLVSLVDKVPA
ncbi:MAG TPA: hypothetical protein VIW45_12450 [Vicinamibacterales bacterium]|jgi:hypothetical protein